MDNYTSWLTKGDNYLNGTTGKNGNPCKFSPVIQYNLLALAFESYVMAILDSHSQLADNHTFTDLLNALEQITPIDINLHNTILKYEEIQLICPLIDYKRRDPTLDEIEELKTAVKEIASLAHKTVQAKVKIALEEIS